MAVGTKKRLVTIDLRIQNLTSYEGYEAVEYQPSQRLEESQLVEDLGIGRTPIREALVGLHGEKMVESHPKRGVIVRPITLQNTKAMFESMNLIEMGRASKNSFTTIS